MKAEVAVDIEKALVLLKKMLITRFADEKMSKLVRQNKGGTFHLSVLGHEMISCASGIALTPYKDWGFPYYRDRGFAIGLGCPLEELIGAFLARDVPHHSGGRMMPEHFSHKELKIPCQSSVVGSQFLQAVGVAKALKISGSNEIVYVSAGDGATSQGDFHEALNFACLHQLNMIFMIQDNGWAISVPVDKQTAGKTIATMASGYEGMSVFAIDGTDYTMVTEALDQAVNKARANLGPSLIVAKVPRIGAHSSSDDPQKYKSQTCMLEDLSRDPLPRFEQFLLEEGALDAEELENLKQEMFAFVEKAAVIADQYPFPERSTAATKVFKEAPLITENSHVKEGSETIVIVDAVNYGLHEAMAQDESIVVFGQDVAGGKGGVFGVSRDLTHKFGIERCFNTPLAESTIVALALGMSLVGNFKPVAEVQFADYIWTGINQLFNELASIHYRSNGEWNCPVVIRMPYGGYIQGGPYHSQSIEAYLAHTPGLKVVIPSNAADAKMLLKAAIADPNPVVILEHKALYRQRVFSARKEPSSEAIAPLGKAHVVRQGSDITFIGYGMMMPMVAEVAEKLSEEGISVEIIDLRSIVPLDEETIFASVKKTGKVLVAHEAALFAGFGAEIAAKITENCFEYLDAPVSRIGGENCMVPYCKQLEEQVLPSADKLKAALLTLARY